MIRVLACILGGVACLAAEASPVWDWLPKAAEDDRPCELHLAAGPGWNAAEAPGLDATRRDGRLVLGFTPHQVPTITITGPDRARIGVRLVAPGAAAGLAIDPSGRFRLGDDAAILAVPRIEASGDRRWGVLRLFEGDTPEPCTHRLGGQPGLAQLIAAAQQMSPAGGSILVELPGEDRFAGWKHREYRQALSWLIADLHARGAHRVVLLEPACPAVDEPLLSALRVQVRDAAKAHRCPVIDSATLGDPRFWEISPGVLGTGLNEAGRQARELLLARWLRPR